MEAAHHRIEAMRRELAHLLPAGSHPEDGPIEAEVIQLRRRLQRSELQLEKEHQRRETAEARLVELRTARERIDGLERMLARFQKELRWYTKEHAKASRDAIAGMSARRDAGMLREQMDRERIRADAAEAALARVQMRLAMQQARQQVVEPWSLVAPELAAADLHRAYAHGTLCSLDTDSLREPLERLALLFAEQLWSLDAGSHDGLARLIDLLRRGGHPLATYHRGVFAPIPSSSVGLSISIAPTCFRLLWRRTSGGNVVVTIAESEPMRVALVPA